ncbi:hypothetical protein CMUS01_09392 [Colletotrichum musicola]|uniref:Uncharacterized protein n=1 Tax=Colletotrichum musicola TaxID=2175873 RepID=A0A8H6K7K8_9PEZI|nr:hypothetical protein CMUS01_09392 [Colletotrichum musicola]
MRGTLLFLSAIATTQVLASPTPDFPPASAGVFFSSPGYVVPSNVSANDFDESASWMQRIDAVDDDEEPSLAARDGHDHELSLLRDRAEASTTIFMGRTYTDYGCEADIAAIQSILADAIVTRCGNGWCDRGSKYARKITWMADGGYRRDAWVEVKVEGMYWGKDTRHWVREGVMAMVRDDTVQREKRSRQGTWTGINHSCDMGKFTNYIYVHKVGDLAVDIQLDIELNNVNADCITVETAEKVAGAIHGAAGGFFGAVAMVCGQY